MGVNGTGWICSSDRNVKERVESITPSRVLAGVLAMPVSKWSIIGSKVRQMGPMAQDFYAAFGLGADNKHISTVDADGVAFAAIQELNMDGIPASLGIDRVKVIDLVHNYGFAKGYNEALKHPKLVPRSIDSEFGFDYYVLLNSDCRGLNAKRHHGACHANPVARCPSVVG